MKGGFWAVAYGFLYLSAQNFCLGQHIGGLIPIPENQGLGLSIPALFGCRFCTEDWLNVDVFNCQVFDCFAVCVAGNADRAESELVFFQMRNVPLLRV